MTQLAQDDEREEELTSLQAIYPEEFATDPQFPYCACITIPVALENPLSIVFSLSPDALPTLTPNAPPSTNPKVHKISYLPPLRLEIELPKGYPSNEPPRLRLSTSPPWLSHATLQRLEEEGQSMWDEYGRGQVLFAYISYLQEAAERGFDAVDTNTRSLEVSQDMQAGLLDFNIKAKREKFERETFVCGVCLEPKKGYACYRLEPCQHVFCTQCLQDYYNNCIIEGDVGGVKCLSPDCGKEEASAGDSSHRKKKERHLTPNQLLQVPLEPEMVQRYANLKRKKKIESDKSTIYCPREWCQGAARSKKYPKITDLTQIAESDSEEEEEEEEEEEPVDKTIEKMQKPKGTPDSDRLAICEDCNYAFCNVCLGGWHGEFVRCWPRNPSELTEEERASMNFILANTSPCPYCSVPCLKSHGCNHMTCSQCKTHFCYLCSSWLNPENPYQHFNESGRKCYQRLWELEEGDDGIGGGHFDGARAAEAAAQRAQHVAEEIQRQEFAAAAREQGGDPDVEMIDVGVEPAPQQRAPERHAQQPEQRMAAQQHPDQVIRVIDEGRGDEWTAEYVDDGGHRRRFRVGPDHPLW